jgi:hypothetical protein
MRAAISTASVAAARRGARGHRGGAQDAALVHVLARIEGRRPAPSSPRAAITRSRAEGRRTPRGSRARRPGRPARRRRPPAVDPGLSLAVIAEAAGLQDRGRADRGQRGLQVGRSVDRAKGAVASPRPARKVFSVSRSWLTRSASRPGRIGSAAPARRARGGDVLELVGDDIAGPAKARQRLEIVIGACRPGGDMAAGRSAPGS